MPNNSGWIKVIHWPENRCIIVVIIRPFGDNSPNPFTVIPVAENDVRSLYSNSSRLVSAVNSTIYHYICFFTYSQLRHNYYNICWLNHNFWSHPAAFPWAVYPTTDRWPTNARAGFPHGQLTIQHAQRGEGQDGGEAGHHDHRLSEVQPGEPLGTMAAWQMFRL